jgi:hypothetical protein
VEVVEAGEDEGVPVTVEEEVVGEVTVIKFAVELVIEDAVLDRDELTKLRSILIVEVVREIDSGVLPSSVFFISTSRSEKCWVPVAVTISNQTRSVLCARRAMDSSLVN